MGNDMIFKYGEEELTPGLALEIARDQRKGIIDRNASEKIEANFNAVKGIVESEYTVYGVNTGFGPLCNTKIAPEDTIQLQYNILRSHSAGVGEPVPTEVAKLMMIIKCHALSQGYSGINPKTLERIIWHIDNNVIPVVPDQGSVGASGDLAPLSHLFLPLIGLGMVEVDGETVESEKALKAAGLEPLSLGPKEGLALINGTQFICAYSVRALERFQNCLDTADIIGAMTLEALLGSVKPFTPKLHELRPYKGNKYVADRLRLMLEGSEILKSHEFCDRVQDPYSLRCMPQVHGASRNCYLHLKEMLTIELNSVTDNPVILSETEAISGGNFHGQPMALPLDYACVAVSELGNISDRRTYLLLMGAEGLPKLLMKDLGINSGFMIPQYTSASLVTENKTLCFPASADSIPTSLGQEDHVSMGSVSGRKLNRVITNLENILAVELLTAAQAFDFRRPLHSTLILEECHTLIREHIDHADEDRIFGNDLVTARDLIKSQELARTAYRAAEKNSIDLKGGDFTDFSIY